MATTKAIRIHSFGGPEVLQLDEVPFPVAKDDEVVLRVHAGSVNPVDYKIRGGGYPAVKQDMLPIVLGRDVSGTVETCGSRVHALKKSDLIFAFLDQDRGGYAEFVVVKAVEAVAKPDKLDHVHAAAVPLAGVTAYQGLFEHGGLEAGQHVLIHGGSGGVGHFAIQFAKARGAHVATTVAGQQCAFARGLGADQVIDYQTERFEDVCRPGRSGPRLDRGRDTGPVLGRAEVRRQAGLHIERASAEKARQQGVSAMRFMAQPNAAHLAEIGGLIDAGKVRVEVTRTFPLAEAAAA